MELREISDRLLSLLPPGDRMLLVLKEMEDYYDRGSVRYLQDIQKRGEAEVVPGTPPVAACL